MIQYTSGYVLKLSRLRAMGKSKILRQLQPESSLQSEPLHGRIWEERDPYSLDPTIHLLSMHIVELKFSIWGGSTHGKRKFIVQEHGKI
jgi:hypothetical protein